MSTSSPLLVSSSHSLSFTCGTLSSLLLTSTTMSSPPAKKLKTSPSPPSTPSHHTLQLISSNLHSLRSQCIPLLQQLTSTSINTNTKQGEIGDNTSEEVIIDTIASELRQLTSDLQDIIEELRSKATKTDVKVCAPPLFFSFFIFYSFLFC